MNITFTTLDRPNTQGVEATVGIRQAIVVKTSTGMWHCFCYERGQQTNRNADTTQGEAMRQARAFLSSAPSGANPFTLAKQKPQQGRRPAQAPNAVQRYYTPDGMEY